MLERGSQVCGGLLVLEPVTEMVAFSCSQSLQASSPPGAGANLKIVKCTAAILRKVKELKQSLIYSDSFQFSTD